MSDTLQPCELWNWDYDPPRKCVPWPHPKATRDDCPWCKILAAGAGDDGPTFVLRVKQLKELQEAEFGALPR